MSTYQTVVYEPEDNRDHIALRLLDRPIAYHRIFVELTGSVTAAVMLSQAFYWSRRTNDAAGWFYKTQQEWTDETGLTRYEQETARKKLRQHGWWQEDLRKANGSPTLHFRINTSEFYRELTQIASANENVPNAQMDMRESNISNDMRKSSNSINIDYTETTPKSSSASVSPSAEKDDNYHNFVKAMETAWGMGPSSPYDAERIEQWMNEIPLNAWEYALKQAAEAGPRARNWRYLTSILNRVAVDGIPAANQPKGSFVFGEPKRGPREVQAAWMD